MERTIFTWNFRRRQLRRSGKSRNEVRAPKWLPQLRFVWIRHKTSSKKFYQPRGTDFKLFFHVGKFLIFNSFFLWEFFFVIFPRVWKNLKKQAIKERTGRDVVRQVMLERNLLSKLNSDFIVRIFGSFQTNDELFYVLSYQGSGVEVLIFLNPILKVFFAEILILNYSHLPILNRPYIR